MQSLLLVKKINFIPRSADQAFNMQKTENKASSLPVEADGRSKMATHRELSVSARNSYPKQGISLCILLFANLCSSK
jgi:hypothetical protein